jgi:hypothetical protein
MFLAHEKAPRKTPRFTTDPPQIHHNFTTIYHPKTPQNLKNPPKITLSASPNFFFRSDYKN